MKKQDNTSSIIAAIIAGAILLGLSQGSADNDRNKLDPSSRPSPDPILKPYEPDPDCPDDKCPRPSPKP